jgi:hypothetical protein
MAAKHGTPEGDRLDVLVILAEAREHSGYRAYAAIGARGASRMGRKAAEAAAPSTTSRRRLRRGPVLLISLRGRFEIRCQTLNSSTKALASFKSSVSKPSVNQP